MKLRNAKLRDQDARYSSAKRKAQAQDNAIAAAMQQKRKP
jgi:hypothetical protein